MFSYLQVPFLQALGYAIANSLWQIFLLWLIVIVVNGIAKQSSSIKYITAACAQAGGFVWFVTTLQFYYRHCHTASVQAEQLLSQHDTVYTQPLWTDGSLLSYLIKAEETLPYLSIAYLFLLLLLVIKWIRAFRFTQQLSSSALQPPNAGWQRFVNETADRLNILQSVTVHLSSLAKSPMTIGYIKPIILLPFASVNQLTTEQLEAVLLHELAHIRRSDYLINLLASVVEIILFFNPFTRLLSRQIKEERENCCDDWVLQFDYNAAMYAEALLSIAYYQNNETTGLQMSAASTRKGELLQRVKRMIQPQKTFNYKHQVIALFLITALLFSIAWLQPVENSLAKPTANNIKEVDKKIVVTPLTAQVDNPFFNAASLFSKSLQEDVAQSLAEADKTLQDSLTQSSLLVARKAMQEAVPQVITALSSAAWQKMLVDAKKQTAQSLANINWQAVQNEVPTLFDSLSSIPINTNAIQNKINEVAKKNAVNAGEQLAKLNNMKLTFNFSGDLLQKLSGDALCALQNLNFKAIEDSVVKSSQLLNGLLLKQSLQQKELSKKQKEWIKKWQADSIRASYSISNAPLVAPLPPQALHLNDNDDNRSNVIGSPDVPPPPINIFSEPVYQQDAVHPNSASKTIHIISNNDSTTLNIIIEIKQ